ncbi:hypothetical protein FRB99_008094 [Tulasnella sp. 403]|nr:hypothetical protein FRB99_008094 [Tulasnella sp. 403]
MSSPRAIIQIAILGAQIFGKALMAAGKQAVKNAKHRPGGAEEIVGGRGADALTQTHRMTLDEAHLILNVKKGDPIESIIKNYEHLFKINSPPAPPTGEATTTARTGGRHHPATRFHSHYIQSKVVRARERIEAELKIQQEAEDARRLGETPRTEGVPNEKPPAS